MSAEERVFKNDDSKCTARLCVYEARYQILSKRDEYLWRGIECELQVEPHEFRGVWLHDGRHHVCAICGHDAT